MHPIESYRDGPHNLVSELNYTIWRDAILSTIFKHAHWSRSTLNTWQHKSVANRGLQGGSIAADAAHINGMLNHIALFSPLALR